MYGPWRLFEERVRTGPFGLSRFPFQPHSPVRILVFDADGTDGAVDPALRHFIRDSPPRIRGEWHLGLDSEPEDPGLTDEEFGKAMKKLRRHVHNPTYPRKKAWRRGLFSSRSVTGGGGQSADGAEEEKGEGKECAICLEAFRANEQVMMTPCNHMFHHDCIARWVRSRGECPVCRLALCDSAADRQQRREAALARSSGNNGYYYGNSGGAARGIWDDELYYLIRAMEEAFNWVNLSR